MFVTSLEIIKEAQKNGYAVPAFNAENMEMVQGIISAAIEMRSPVLIQTTSPTVKYIGPTMVHAMVYDLAKNTDIPVALHLDHCTSFDDVMVAIHAGYSSVMFDGSRLSFDENLRITTKVAEVAHPMGITVEAELGCVGGKEDNIAGQDIYTDVGEAEVFANRSGVDLLAIAIGTAHGFYKGEPKLDFDRISQIRNVVSAPLVLHGGSGVPEESVKKAISLGMAKVNFATELRDAATKAARKALMDENIIDPKKFMGPAREAVKELCIEKIKMCGSADKA